MERTEHIHNRIAARLLDHIEQRSTDQADAPLQVPSASYLDAALWQREMDVIFKRVPLFAAASAELLPGHYKTLKLIGTSL